jgi:hypothetical protein
MWYQNEQKRDGEVSAWPNEHAHAKQLEVTSLICYSVKQKQPILVRELISEDGRCAVDGRHMVLCRWLPSLVPLGDVVLAGRPRVPCAMSHNTRPKDIAGGTATKDHGTSKTQH